MFSVGQRPPEEPRETRRLLQSDKVLLHERLKVLEVLEVLVLLSLSQLLVPQSLQPHTG